MESNNPARPRLEMEKNEIEQFKQNKTKKICQLRFVYFCIDNEVDDDDDDQCCCNP